MTVSIIGSWRRFFGRWVLRRMTTTELLGHLAKKRVRKERLGSPAVSRLVEEIIGRSEAASADTTEQAHQLLKEAEMIAGDVSAYLNDPNSCDPAVRRILDFHVGLMPTPDDESKQRKT